MDFLPGGLLSAEVLYEEWFKKQSARSHDSPCQQNLMSDQWVEPTLTDYNHPSMSRFPMIDFTSTRQPDFQSQPAPHTNHINHTYEPQTQTPPYNLIYQPEEYKSTENPFSMPLGNNGFLSPHPNHFSHSFEPQTRTPFYDSPYQSEEHYPTDYPISTESMPPRDTVRARAQHPMNVVSRSGSSNSGYASPASAAIITPLPTIAVSTPETDGLQFDSYESACATVDPLFRGRIDVKATDDDILEVENNDKQYVKLLVDALKHEAWMREEEFRKAISGVQTPSTASNKQDWEAWQEKTFGVVEGHFTMPNFEARVERIAWAILEEILTVHRKGFRLTTLTADRTSNCSQRVMLTVKSIKSTAMVRQMILEGCDLSDLAAGPLAYARNSATNRRNNSGRSANVQANGGGNVGGGNVQPRTKKSPAEVLGATAERYMPRAQIARKWREIKKKGKQEGKGAGNSMAGVQQAQEPLAPPTSRTSHQHTWASPPQPTQSGAQRMTNISHPITDVFGGTSNSTIQFAPRGGSNYGAGIVARQSEGYGSTIVPGLNDAGYCGGSSNSATQNILRRGTDYGASPSHFTFRSPAGGLSSANQQAPHDTYQQLQRRRAEDTGRRAAMTNVEPTEFFQASAGMPGESSLGTGTLQRLPHSNGIRKSVLKYI